MKINVNLDIYQRKETKNKVTNINKIYKNYLQEIDQISKACSGLRLLGSASIDLAYVAAGKVDAYWERDLNLWDMSSGVLLIKEAGGKITEPSGDSWNINSKDILASNTKIHEFSRKKRFFS